MSKKRPADSTPPRTPPRQSSSSQQVGTPPQSILTEEINRIYVLINQTPSSESLMGFRQLVRTVSTELNITEREVRDFFEQELERRFPLNQDQINNKMEQYDRYALMANYGSLDKIRERERRPQGKGVKRSAPPRPLLLTNGEVQSIYSYLFSNQFTPNDIRNFRSLIGQARERLGAGVDIRNSFLERLPAVVPNLTPEQIAEYGRRFNILSNYGAVSVTDIDDMVLRRRPPQGRGMYYKTW